MQYFLCRLDLCCRHYRRYLHRVPDHRGGPMECKLPGCTQPEEILVCQQPRDIMPLIWFDTWSDHGMPKCWATARRLAVEEIDLIYTTYGRDDSSHLNLFCAARYGMVYTIHYYSYIYNFECFLLQIFVNCGFC